MRVKKFVASMFFAVTMADIAYAQDRVVSREEALLADARSYASAYNVPLEEAVRRLNLQGFIGKLEAIVADAEGSTFAGLSIENTPEYRIIVRSTDPVAAERILALVSISKIEVPVEVLTTAFSLEDLRAAQAKVHRLARRFGVATDTGIDIRANSVVARTRSPQQLLKSFKRAHIDLPKGVSLVAVERLSSPTANVYGGLPLSTCTIGFSVMQNPWTVGVITAGHCHDTQSYNGSLLGFGGGSFQGSQDVQWHPIPSWQFTVNPTFDSGIGMRNLFDFAPSSQQAIGTWVCKNGKSTTYTCGDLISKSWAPSYVPNVQQSFHYVHSTSSLPMTQDGDSGGPVFFLNTAYGIVSGGSQGDLIYMPIEYMSSLGISLLFQ